MREKTIDLRGHALLWTGISKSIEEGYVILWGNYRISRHVTAAEQNGTGFMIFNRIEGEPSLFTPDAKPKLHIALHDENYLDPNSDIQTTFNAILQVLDHEKIKCFKVILSAHLSTLIQSGQYGKIFTIYLAGGNEHRAIEIAHAIETCIKAARTYPPLKPPTQTAVDCETRQDRGIVNCDFVTYATNRNGMVTFNNSGLEGHLAQPPSRSASDVSTLVSRSGSQLLPFPHNSASNVSALFNNSGSQLLFTAPKTTLRGAPSSGDPEQSALVLFVPAM